ncbi:MAG: UDP-N-acetylmuramoyl-L-alanine--D-glutamate ligase [Anaerolineales bacterium]|nr:UDP-N-acetylmuramoyl-L-alanine--D-glutamate ligase [Anaerolineales bacterium]
MSQMSNKDWNGRKVIIVGAARQGLALAGYLARNGAQVVLNDRLPLDSLAAARQALAGLPVEWVCGGHPLSLLDGADLLCPSGGVPLTLPLVAEAQARGIPLSNDSQVFLQATPCKVIGVTGSAGKTTTTTLVGRMAQQAAGGVYRRAWVGGNIGSPLIAMLDEMQADDLAVMELSSFQLEIMARSPQVAAVLNLTPNHLDRHGSMQAYTAAKAHILAFQTPQDVAVFGRDDPGAWSLTKMTRGRIRSFGFSELPDGQAGVFYRQGAIYLREEAQPVERQLLSRQDIALRGEHNVLNVMAACAIAAAAGLPEEAMRSGVRGFTGVPHRLEFVRSWGGADWYNDSIATAPERAIAAIRSFDEPLVLLAGGRDKNLPWDAFAALARQRVERLIVFGEAAELILKAVTSAAASNGNDLLSVERCKGLREAVQAAAQIVEPGDVVLLSPGGTSFDEFKDFEERGECFAQWVKELP